MECHKGFSYSEQLSASESRRSHARGALVATTAKDFSSGASAVTAVKRTKAKVVSAAPQQQRLLRQDDPRVLRDPAPMRRIESAAQGAQGTRAESERQSGRAHTISAAGDSQKRAVKPSTIPNASLPQAAKTPVSASTAIPLLRHTKTAMQRSTSSAVSKADHPGLHSFGHSQPAVKKSKGRAASSALTKTPPSKGSSGSRRITQKDIKSPSRLHRSPTFAHTNSSPLRSPAAEASVVARLAPVPPRAATGSVTCEISAFTSMSGVLPASTADSVSSLSRTSRNSFSDGPIFAASCPAPMCTASSDTPSASRSFKAEPFPLSPSMPEHSISRRNSLAPSKTLSILRKRLPKLPPSMPHAFRNSYQKKAANCLTEEADTAVPAPTAPQANWKAPRSKSKNGGTKAEARKVDAQGQASVATPDSPARRLALQHNVSTESDSGTFDSFSRPSVSALFHMAKSRTLGSRQSLSDYKKGSVSSFYTMGVAGGSFLNLRRSAGGSSHFASAASAALFSTSAMYAAAAEVSSSSSVSSDASSSSISAHAALTSSSRASLHVSPSASAKASSSLWSILRVPAVTPSTMAAEVAERAKRRRRNAHFALFGFAATSPDGVSPREIREPAYAQPAETPSAAGLPVATGRKEEEAALVSFDKVRTETADARWLMGERHPARWWGKTRERVAVTKTMVELWQKDTIAQWHEEQVEELDVLTSSVDAVGNRVHEVLTRELKELVWPDWVIYSSDSLVRRMLRTPDELGKGIRTRGMEKNGEDTSVWKGPPAYSIFGDHLLMLSQAPYTILGVYARRTWAASLPSAVANHMFAEAEAERQRLVERKRPPRDKAEIMRTRFALGAKNVLAALTFGVAPDRLRKQGKVCRGLSRSSLPALRTTVEKERGFARTAPSTATAAAPGTSVTPEEAVAVADGAAAAGRRSTGAPFYVNHFSGAAAGNRQLIQQTWSPCKDVLAKEVAACLGVRPSRCPFPIEALKPHPPHGYGRAPIEEENVRIFSDLEDFLYVNRVPIKRPPGDYRSTPLLSTLKHVRGIASDEDATSATKTGESSSDEGAYDRETAVTRPRETQGQKPLLSICGDQASELCQCISSKGGSLQATPRAQQCCLCTCTYQQPGVYGREQESLSGKSFLEKRSLAQPTPGPLQKPLYTETVWRADTSLAEAPAPKLCLMDSSVSPAEQGSGVLLFHRGEDLGEKERDQLAAQAQLGWDRLVGPHLQRSTAPQSTSYARPVEKKNMADRHRMDRQTVGARMRSQSSMDISGTIKQAPSVKLKQQHTPRARHTRWEKGIPACWELKSYCEQTKHKAGKKILDQEDVKVSEFWRLHFKEDGTSVWSYEGLQCQPITVSSRNSATLRSRKVHTGSELRLVPVYSHRR